MLAEMVKCDVVCANCHEIRTHKRRMGKLKAVRKSKVCAERERRRRLVKAVRRCN